MGTPVPPVLINELDAFVESAKPKRRCSVCTLPDDMLQIVRENKRRPKPHTHRVVSQFLVSRGHRVTPNMIRDHFVLGHEEI